MPHGATRLKLEPPACLHRENRNCHIDTTSEVGRAIASIFFGYARREFGEASVAAVPSIRIERMGV